MLLGYQPDTKNPKKTPYQIALDEDKDFDTKINKYRDVAIVSKNNYENIESMDLEDRLQLLSPNDLDLEEMLTKQRE